MAKTDEGQVSVKQLKGMLHDPKRKPATIEEMNEAIMRAACKGNVPDSAFKKRFKSPPD